MPRVRILQAVAGEDFSWLPGEEVDMSAKEAAIWADGERGELVREEQADTPERGQASPETAATKSRAPRTRKTT